MKETKRAKVSEYVYQEIKRKIIEFEYEPNEHLIEEVLAETLNVSRTPLREALSRLQMEHLVTKKSTGQIIVSRLTIEEAKELFEVREFLQALVARESAIHMTDELIGELELIMRSMEKAANEGRKTEVVVNGRDFHKMMYKAVRNRTAISFLEQLRSRIERYRRIGGYKHPDYAAELPVVEHGEIMKHLRNRDPDGAERAMRQHIRNSLKRTIETLELYFPKL